MKSVTTFTQWPIEQRTRYVFYALLNCFRYSSWLLCHTLRFTVLHWLIVCRVSAWCWWCSKCSRRSCLIPASKEWTYTEQQALGPVQNAAWKGNLFLKVNGMTFQDGTITCHPCVFCVNSISVTDSVDNQQNINILMFCTLKIF